MPSSRREQAQNFTATRNAIYEEHTQRTLASSLESIDAPLPPASVAAVRVANIAAEADPYGDGDQTLLRNPSTHPLRAAWSTGLDVQFAVLTEEEAFGMHRSAWQFDLEDVHDLIREARQTAERGQSHAMTKLLERRISLLRLTPLHYACHAARSLRTVSAADSETAYAVVDALCKAGARVDARDIAGYTPLSTAAGFQTTPASLRLVRLLVAHGADPNVRTRFGEGLLVPPIMSGNRDAFRELLRVGADVTLPDRSGLTPRRMASNSPELLRVMTEVQREKTLEVMECDQCGKTGASKYCSACHKVYYCSKECQKTGWKGGHKEECGKDSPNAQYVDIDVETMTSQEPVPGLGTPTVEYVNNITGMASNKQMKPKQSDVSFTVKVSDAIVIAGSVGCVKISIKNSDYLLVSPTGTGRVAHVALRRLVRGKGLGLGKVYLNARWHIDPGNLQSSARHVLRVDVSKVLPPPKQVW